jgi:hypothetical protein
MRSPCCLCVYIFFLSLLGNGVSSTREELNHSAQALWLKREADIFPLSRRLDIVCVERLPNISGRTEGRTSVKVKVKFTLRLVFYRQSVSVCVKPLETHDQTFFFQLNPCGNNPHVNILSDEKRGSSLMNMLGLSSSAYIAHTAYYLKFFLLHYTIQVLCRHRLCKAEHAYRTVLQQQLIHLKDRPPSLSLFIFSMSGFAE